MPCVAFFVSTTATIWLEQIRHRWYKNNGSVVRFVGDQCIDVRSPSRFSPDSHRHICTRAHIFILSAHASAPTNTHARRCCVSMSISVSHRSIVRVDVNVCVCVYICVCFCVLKSCWIRAFLMHPTRLLDSCEESQKTHVVVKQWMSHVTIMNESCHTYIRYTVIVEPNPLFFFPSSFSFSFACSVSCFLFRTPTFVLFSTPTLSFFIHLQAHPLKHKQTSLYTCTKSLNRKHGWVRGCMGAWVRECVGAWVRGCVGACVSVRCRVFWAVYAQWHTTKWCVTVCYCVRLFLYTQKNQAHSHALAHVHTHAHAHARTRAHTRAHLPAHTDLFTLTRTLTRRITFTFTLTLTWRPSGGIYVCSIVQCLDLHA